MEELLKEFSDVFAGKYFEMPGVDTQISTHKLNINPTAIPVKQATRFFKPELELQIKEEVEKVLAAGFMKPIQHPIWLSSIVPVKKKNGAIRVLHGFQRFE